MTSVTVSGSTIELEDVTAKSSRELGGIDMNLTLVAAIALLLLWGVLVFVAHNGSGPVHLLYAVSVMLFARRIIAGASKFVS